MGIQQPERRNAAKQIREDAAELAFLRTPAVQLSNGEETDYRNSNNQLNFIANHTKGLPHDSNGFVEPAAYIRLLTALTSCDPIDFENIPLGPDPLPAGRTLRRFANPQAGAAFDLEGPDGPSLTIPPAPRIDGAENSAEMGELYWMALLRDVNFSDYDTNPTVAMAIDSLNNEFTDFRGPSPVSAENLFRGFTPGDLVGPYISQFLLRGNAIEGLPPGGGGNVEDGFIQFGTLLIDQRQRTVMPGIDFMTGFPQWLDVQNGLDPASAGIVDAFDSTRRFIRNGRDLGNYVHFDRLYQAYLNAGLLLLGMEAPFDLGNPYLPLRTQNQQGFATFGGDHILTLLTEVTTRALKAVWYQKWFVHRRLRPEAFGGLISLSMMGTPIPQIDSEILNSSVLGQVQDMTGTYLLPMLFPEGSPMHPAYGAGHATVAGGCVTMLKAFFAEFYVLPEPYFVANADGTALDTYSGSEPLTVGGELNKLAANISIGRNIAGVHWRTDYTESVRLGEAIAIGILEEQAATYNENQFFTLTKFDGETIRI
ncbi:MAG: vanadium-dependent haloperoxidase [Cyanobacteria bacterium P01_G01_bin.19]